MKDRLSLVIPTYNEAETIEKLCYLLIEALSKERIDFEIIIVDDDSPDGTWQIAQGLAARERVIKVIRRLGERGLGSAVVEGWRQAQGDILGVIDGDLQHPPELITTMMEKMLSCENADIIVASRHIKGGGVPKWSLLRRFISWLGALVSVFFLPRTLAKVKDPMSGYFILRRRVIQNKSLAPLGYKILLEVLAKGNYRKIFEIPYFFQERKDGASKADLKQYITSLMHMIRLSVQTGEIYRVITYLIVALLALVAALIYLARINLP